MRPVSSLQIKAARKLSTKCLTETHLLPVWSEARETLIRQLSVKIIEGLLLWTIVTGIVNSWRISAVVRRV